MRRRLFIFMLLLCTTSFLLLGAGCSRSDKEGESKDLTVSWMTTWATTGQLMCTLTQTNILETQESNAKFKSFLFGPEMNEAARAGAVNATNTGIVPTINLLAADDDWVVVARLIYFPLATVAPEDSGIRSIDDLVGKRVGVPFGGGSHPYIIQRIEEAGLTIGSGENQVQLVNLKPPDQPIAYLRGDVDAVATWEPQTAISKAQKPSIIIDRDTHVGYLSIRQSYIDNNPEEVTRLLQSYIVANLFMAKNRSLTDKWFVEISGFDPDLLNNIEVIEPNLSASRVEDVDILISDNDLSRTQRIADVMHEHGLTQKQLNFKSYVDLSFAEEARRRLIDSSNALEKIKATSVFHAD